MNLSFLWIVLHLAMICANINVTEATHAVDIEMQPDNRHTYTHTHTIRALHNSVCAKMKREHTIAIIGGNMIKPQDL